MKQSIYIALCASTLSYAQAPAIKPIEQRSFAQSQFIPDISLIMDASYVSRNKDQDELEGLSIPGISEDVFSQGDDGHGHAHSAYSSDNGFNFNYAELILSANVDPSFSLDAVLHFEEDTVGVEEAYFTNTTMADGLRLRGGKFLSDFGRLNKQHPHFWDFNEAPLVYEGFLGYDHLNEVGVQLQYTLPLDEYVMIGLELLQGDNAKTFGNDTITLQDDNNVSTEIKGADAPSMAVGYLKTSFDIGDMTVMPGVSYVYGKSRLYHDHGGHEVAFDGSSELYNVELTIKHYFDSYSFLAWQTEWMYLEKSGDEYHIEGANPVEVFAQKIKQEGYYSQLVYAHNSNLRFGARYESIYKNEYAFLEEALPSDRYKRYTLMGEYHFSEFSRLRLEYIHNNALYKETANGFASEDVDSVLLSINLSIGAHGAHDF